MAGQERPLEPGLSAEVAIRVEPHHTAKSLFSGAVEAYGTPALLALIEEAAFTSVQPLLPPGLTTVGTRVLLRHIAATPVGARVVARSLLERVEGRRLMFGVEVFDDVDKIGEATHERHIVDANRFRSKLEEKRNRITGGEATR
jgi:predicted thioesterase